MWIIGVPDLIPHLAVRVAKAPEGAELLGIHERHGGAIKNLRLIDVRLTAGGFRAIKTDLGMRAIAEGLFLRLTASA
ncbi:hypothetical protein [Bradyrhizobium sp. BR13661]|jgi:hypothetical protein|uniref:hypothetical protein n=1 Tax=Bradyrhizobium sp. BR13661 TaxID=2940622 RepID=UPI002476622F|nr:hypothetical protein [Bradyrhizobium sp. BR13661]MDH6257507.1 hypothetical protein [Bradyrhizobium sp. BR13661]